MYLSPTPLHPLMCLPATAPVERSKCKENNPTRGIGFDCDYKGRYMVGALSAEKSRGTRPEG